MCCSIIEGKMSSCRHISVIMFFITTPSVLVLSFFPWKNTKTQPKHRHTHAVQHTNGYSALQAPKLDSNTAKQQNEVQTWSKTYNTSSMQSILYLAVSSLSIDWKCKFYETLSSGAKKKKSLWRGLLFKDVGSEVNGGMIGWCWFSFKNYPCLNYTLPLSYFKWGSLTAAIRFFP